MADRAKTRESLQRLADFVGGRTGSLGFEDGPDGSPADPGGVYARGVNAPGTWTSALAGQEAESVKEPFNKLAGDFAGLYSILVSEKDSPSLQDD